MQCQLHFDMLSHQFSGDRAKVSFVISLLSERARQWAESLWNSKSPVIRSIDSFIAHFKDVFGTSTSSLSVHEDLFQLRQANRNIQEYTIHFRTLAASSGWNETALLSAYRRRLNPKLRQQTSIFEDAVGLERFLLEGQHVSQHLCVVSTEERTPSDTSPTNDSPNHEAMQTDQYHLSATERQRCIRLKLCLYCGEEGHLLQTCPVRPPRPAVSTIQINTVVNNPWFHDAVLIHANQSFPVKILFDSGSSGNLFSSRLLSAFNIPRQRSPTCYQITTMENHWAMDWCGGKLPS